MKLHPREPQVRAADLEISQAVIAAWERHDLTYAEMLTILTGTLGRVTKYLLRAERHPEQPGRPAGLEGI